MRGCKEHAIRQSLQHITDDDDKVSGEDWGVHPVAVAAGRSHTLALCQSGQVCVWGRHADVGDNDWFLDDDEHAESVRPQKLFSQKSTVARSGGMPLTS